MAELPSKTGKNHTNRIKNCKLMCVHWNMEYNVCCTKHNQYLGIRIMFGMNFKRMCRIMDFRNNLNTDYISRLHLNNPNMIFNSSFNEFL